jgi:hypothetical protein
MYGRVETNLKEQSGLPAKHDVHATIQTGRGRLSHRDMMNITVT